MALAEPVFPGGAAARYVESSALIAAKLEGDATAWRAIRGEGERFASALTLAEFARRLIRGRHVGDVDGLRRRMTW